MVMASERSFNVAMRNIGLWILLEGTSDENHMISEIWRINEIGMGQNRKQRDTLRIRKGLNKFHIDWLRRDQRVRVSALVIGWFSRQNQIVNGLSKRHRDQIFFANKNLE
jgi:hypothetical protein